MKLITKQQWLSVVAIAGLILTGCGSEADWGEGYKAESAIEGDQDPATVTNTVANPADMSVGDVYTVIFDSENEGEISFGGVDPSSQFVLVLSALDTAQTVHTVQMADENADAETLANVSAAENNWNGWSAHEALDQQLRAAETVMSISPELEKAAPNTAAAGAMKAMFVASVSVPSVGDVESFKVLNSLSSLSSYKTVQGEVKCVENNVIFYLDTQMSGSGDLTDADVEGLCTEFDRVSKMEYEIFGEPSDVNGDGHVAVLMTPQVNRLGAMGGGIITGFFFANDLYSSANSNNREIIYVMVPDSSGKYGTTIPKQFAMDNLLPAVLPHELQHAINYNQKVFVNSGTAEENWLNEALSHLSEDLTGYNQENPSRVEVFLSNPSYYGVAVAGSPGLAERGASYLFLRYMYEQSADGGQFIWDLLHSGHTGAENVEDSFGSADQDFDQFSEFTMRWATTLVMSSFNLSTDSRYSYKERGWNAETEHWEGICLACDTEDGRGTILTGVTLSTYYGVSQISLEATSSQFYKITSFPQVINLTAKSSGTYGAALIRFE